MMNNPIPRIIVSTIASFILSISLFGVFALVSIWITIFNEESILDQMTKTDYYELTTNSITSDFDTICDNIGIPHEIISNAFVSAHINDDIIANLKSCFDKKEPVKNISRIETSIRQALDEYCSTEGKTFLVEDENYVGMSYEESLDMVTGFFSAAYENSIYLPMYESYVFLKDIFAIHKVMTLPFLIIITVVCLIILRLSFIHTKKFLLYCYFSSAAAGLMLCLPSAIFLATKSTLNFAIQPEYALKLFAAVLNSALINSVWFGAVILVDGIIMFVVSSVSQSGHYNVLKD